MDILLISLAPVVIIAGYIWFRDKYDREPVRLLIYSLMAGAFLVLPVTLVEMILSGIGGTFENTGRIIWKAFAVAGFTEEGFKYLALILLFWNNREFNDKYDGIVYGTFISLGFAGIENILYVINQGYATGLVRAFTAVPAHAIFGITMGFYVGMAKFYPKKRNSMKYRAFFIPILLHGIYDLTLMTGIEWLWVVFIGFVIFLYISGLRRLKNLADLSFFKTDYDLLNQKFSNDDQDT